MRLPRRVLIGHRSYDIISWSRKASEQADARGQINPEPPAIRIATYLTPLDKVEVMLHEIIHGILWKEDLAEDIEEDVVTTLGEGLAQVFRDNAELLEWIAKTVRDGR